MLIPLGTEVRLRRPTLVTYALMALCVVVFVGQQAVDGRTPGGEPPGYARFMLHGVTEDADRPPREFMAFMESTDGEREVVNVNPARWYQYVTYQFLHGGWLHLIGNMVFLMVFGPPVEDRFRRVGFLTFYLLGGVLAGAAHGLLEVRTEAFGDLTLRTVTPILGASGSIAAVTGAYLILFPKAPVRLFAFFFVYFGRFSVPGWVFVLMGVFFDVVYLGFGSRGVAHIAHLGGYLAGAGVAMFLLWRHIIDRQPYDLFSMARQAHRRRTYKALVAKGPERSPFMKDAPHSKRIARPQRDPEDTLGPRRREVTALTRTDPQAAADMYLELLGEDAQCTLSRDAQLAVANVLYERGDHQNGVDAYERFLSRHPGDREEAQTRLLVAMVCARQLNDPVCATRHLDAIEDEDLPEGLRELADTIREELG